MSATYKVFSYREYLRSNIYAVGKIYRPLSQNIAFLTPGKNSFGNQTNGAYSNKDSKALSAFVTQHNQLKKYEYSEISNIVVNLIADYISNYIQRDVPVISITDPKYKKQEDKINKIFDKIELVDEVINNLYSFVYYENYSFLIKYNNGWQKESLFDPNFSIEVKGNDGNFSNVLVLGEGSDLEIMSRKDLFRLGGTGIHLTNDLDYSTELSIGTTSKDYSLTSAKPLFFGLLDKLKEYLLKDKLISILTIRDLITPLVYLMKVERTTPVADANELALNTEKLINGFMDSSMLLGDFLDPQELIYMLLNNIKVLPDFNLSAQDMGTLDLSKISDKIDKMRSELDQNRDDLLSSVGMPSDLYKGGTTSAEAIKSNERFARKILKDINVIRTSIAKEAVALIKRIDGIDIPSTSIVVNLFSKTTIEYDSAIANAEIVKTLLETIRSIFEDNEAFLANTKLVNKEKLLKYIRSTLKEIDPTIEEFISNEDIQNFIKSVSAEQSASPEEEPIR